MKEKLQTASREFTIYQGKTVESANVYIKVGFIYIYVKKVILSLHNEFSNTRIKII
jgi:hypothetical protein